jgi:hypothetical protein
MWQHDSLIKINCVVNNSLKSIWIVWVIKGVNNADWFIFNYSCRTKVGEWVVTLKAFFSTIFEAFQNYINTRF